MAEEPLRVYGSPTLNDVARVAGVSRATVSRVMHGGKSVRPETVERVRAAADQLGYLPNFAARSLVTQRIGTVALIVPEAEERNFDDPYFFGGYLGALEGFADTDIQVVLAMARPGDGVQRLVAYLSSGRADGAIIMSRYAGMADVFEGIAQPVVFVGQPLAEGHHWADIDQLQAARRATRRLIERGATRIATICGPSSTGAGCRRLAGFQQEMAAHGLDASRVVEGDFTIAGGEAAAARLFGEHPDVDGVFVGNDQMSVGVLKHLVALGRRVPEDVLLVGFDDASVASHTIPPLTTMRNPSRQLARVAAGMLLRLLHHQPTPKTVVLQSQLVIRDSG